MWLGGLDAIFHNLQVQGPIGSVCSRELLVIYYVTQIEAAGPFGIPTAGTPGGSPMKPPGPAANPPVSAAAAAGNLPANIQPGMHLPPGNYLVIVCTRSYIR